VDESYEARYRPTLAGVVAMLGAAGFVAAALLLDMPLALQVLVVVFFGFSGVLMLVSAVSGKTALRADESGVTLGPGVTLPGWRWGPRPETCYPWDEVVDIVLWRQHVVFSKIDWVGVVRRDDAPPLPNSGGRWQQLGAAVVPHVPPELVTTSIQINGWAVDLPALRASVARFAPTVRVIDIRKRGRG
jgi:hypothetical protein